jgi:Na+/H+-dicarboxylate symporter
LIFAAVRMPVDKIPILLTVDWLLDRLRTTSNVLGDMTVAVLLDRVSPPRGPVGDVTERIAPSEWDGETGVSPGPDRTGTPIG